VVAGSVVEAGVPEIEPTEAETVPAEGDA